MGVKNIGNENKILHGTNQPCRMQDESVGFERIKTLPRHSELQGREWRIYKVIASEFINKQLLETVNDALVVMYAKEMGLYFDSMEKLKQEGYVINVATKDGVARKINPLRRIANEAFTNANKLASDFGLSPASRIRIAAMMNGTKEQPKDEFSDFETI
jgi:P27 family predicted phage terminase small subunit